MQQKAQTNFILLALLPLFIIAVAFLCNTPKKGESLTEKIPSSISKVLVAHQNNVPFVSNDIPQISRADNRSPLKNWLILLSVFFALSSLNINIKRVVVFSASSYSGLFKTLFPEHEFS